ncbi:MAG: rRNA maturation RNase YbeY [Roseivirga sp.]|nr:rRNA maturation RNase YbeY [Roseivirga sp.]
MESIHFFYEDITFTLEAPSLTQSWIDSIISDHELNVEAINFIFCSDDYLLDINRTYLDHDYYTDIITFDNREPGTSDIESDIFISIDRIRDNARDMNISFGRELHRVIIHGILHLLGWNDKTDEQKQVMREKEEACLSLHPNYH